jgi:hypothetical protein
MQFGKKPERTALPETKDATANSIVITASESRSYEKDFPPRPSSMLTVQIPERDEREHRICVEDSEGLRQVPTGDKFVAKETAYGHKTCSSTMT